MVRWFLGGCGRRPQRSYARWGLRLSGAPDILGVTYDEGTAAVADNIAQDALDAQNLERAIRLKVRGAHWSEIARQCGFSSPAAALAAVGEAMAQSTRRAEETADQLRDTANLQLDALIGEAWDMLDADAPLAYDNEGNPLAQDDRAVKLRAVDEIRRLVIERAKLNGYDKPDKGEDDKGDVQTIRIVGIDPKDLI